MVIVVLLNRKEFCVFVLLVYNPLLFFVVIRPVVGPPLSRKKTDPVSRFEIFTLDINNFYQTFHFLKNIKMFMLLLYIYFIIRYHQFKDEWKAKKAPGEKSHKNLRWNVRVMSDYVTIFIIPDQSYEIIQDWGNYPVQPNVSEFLELILMSSFVLFPKGKNVAV